MEIGLTCRYVELPFSDSWFDTASEGRRLIKRGDLHRVHEVTRVSTKVKFFLFSDLAVVGSRLGGGFLRHQLTMALHTEGKKCPVERNEK